jgi:acyl-CoA reductase-like NAD-dependent aldehyde dehydrogenase
VRSISPAKSCISVQRIMVHRSIYDTFRERLVCRDPEARYGKSAPRRNLYRSGDLRGRRVAARDLDSRRGFARGGRVLAGGRARASCWKPRCSRTFPKDADLCAKEAFGRVAVLSTFDDFDAALDEVNDSVYGLQAGVFTRDIYQAQRAWDRREVGAVVVGDVPSFRVDNMALRRASRKAARVARASASPWKK